MAATYNPTEPIIRDVIRGILQDVDNLTGSAVGDPRLQDETIDARVSRFGEVEGAAKCAESIAAFWSKEVVRYGQAGEDTAFASDRHRFYLNLAQSIRANGLGGAAAGSSVRAGAPALPQYGVDNRLILSSRQF